MLDLSTFGPILAGGLVVYMLYTCPLNRLLHGSVIGELCQFLYFILTLKLSCFFFASMLLDTV